MKLIPRTFLGGLNPEEFLQEYWQKKPLLVRDALPPRSPTISAEELAGLACDEEVESRLVVFNRQHEQWELSNGPFSEEQFAELPAEDWTFLVQDLEQHVEPIASLLQHVDFLPNWRIDDIMASYAAPGGSVGPHFDQYDVFLLQIEGQRRWRLCHNFDATDLVEDCPLALLRDFQVEQEWLLNPGDVLYLPPSVAHWGVAQGPCMTFSIGCRAPSVAELITEVVHSSIDGLSEAQRYRDPTLQPAAEPSVLAPSAVEGALRLIREALPLDSKRLAPILGRLVTQPKALFIDSYSEDLSLSEAQVIADSSVRLEKRIGSRWLCCGDEQQPWLCVNGNAIALLPEHRRLAVDLCASRGLDPAPLERWRAQAHHLLLNLLQLGALVPPQPEPGLASG